MSDGKKYETLERLTQIAPLGLDVFTRGKISTDNMVLVGNILKDFSKVIDEYYVEHIKAVATSAVREASNRELFINRVQKISGIKLQILESPEESRIMFLALNRTIGDKFALIEKMQWYVLLALELLRFLSLREACLKVRSQLGLIFKIG